MLSSSTACLESGAACCTALLTTISRHWQGGQGWRQTEDAAVLTPCPKSQPTGPANRTGLSRHGHILMARQSPVVCTPAVGSPAVSDMAVAAMSCRNKAAYNQEVAALKAAVQQATAGAAAATSQHEQQLKVLEQQHAAQLTAVEVKLQSEARLHLQAVRAEHEQQLRDQHQQLATAAASTFRQLQCEFSAMQHQQLQQVTGLSECLAALKTQGDDLAGGMKMQLQSLHEEVSQATTLSQQVLSLAAAQRTSLQQLQQQVADVAPEGLQVLQQQTKTARYGTAVHN